MSLRQRAPRVVDENWRGNGHVNINGSVGLGQTYDQKRVKGRKRDTRPWVSLPLLAFFAFVVGCSYVAMGGTSTHDHGHHFHSAVDSVHHAAIRVLTPNHPLPKNLRQGSRLDRRRNLVQTIDKQKPKGETKREHIPLKDNTQDEDEQMIKVNVKERLINLDHVEETEQVRKEKKELLNQIRKKQRMGLKKLPQHNIEEEVTEKMDVHKEDEKSAQFEVKYDANDWVGSCQRQAKDRMKDAHSLEAAVQWMEDLANCTEKELVEELVDLNRAISLQARTRHDIAGQLENYTCTDPHAPGSPDLSSHIWAHSDGNSRIVHVKHNRSSSQIHVIDNFIDEEECAAMEKTAEPSLHTATVADGKGGSKVSDHRRAKQAGIRVPWQKEKNGDPIARLSRRVYDYANHALGLNIDEHGQEDLMSIQYFGRGKDDEHPDRYMPHCDGDCTGLPHHAGTRMATMVVYCTVPTVGGATNFRNAGVHVKPVVGNAVFFSYMDPKTRITDNRFTEHSGCPVYEGEKKIVTQWIRMGVDASNPWDSFNTLGIRMKDAKAYE